ncbi:MAG: UDPGP type 1 family protein [Lachnospiraceae bacterium]|nr:UDPGP type 1 family protein [Lachnospiraceae bacterium]
MNLQEARQKLAKYSQEHVLKYYETLSASEQESLLKQIDETDFSVINKIKHSPDGNSPAGEITPIHAMQIPEIEEHQEQFLQVGTTTIKEGKVAAVLLAGGMGTRLGSDHPKGMYDIGLTKSVYIFERIISNLLDVVQQTDTWIHLFIMTSDKNHADTTGFFQTHDFFGYRADHIHFFQQDMAPAATYDGKVYMEAKHKIATSPNGNGGWFSSLQNAGLLDFIHTHGIEWLNVFAVDNVLQRIADPCFVGATISQNCSVGAKVVRKNDPDEKVGVMCLKDGHPSIVEYYEQTPELRDTKDENGDPAYNFGVILNYLFRISSLEEICEREMPLHIVEKKIPFIDDDAALVNPVEPNGYKFETLILDMIELMDTCLPFEVVRDREFAPIKNKTGIDSVESARALLQQNGVTL